jgi:hypothetical protein
MGIWYCDICESILPDYRCELCPSNLCKEDFNTYLKNSQNLKQINLEKELLEF